MKTLYSSAFIYLVFAGEEIIMFITGKKSLTSINHITACVVGYSGIYPVQHIVEDKLADSFWNAAGG